MPRYPEPKHVLFMSDAPQSVRIDGTLYEANTRWKSSAPYRTVINLDGMRDLPRVDNDHDQLEMSYVEEAVSHFQREMRQGSEKLPCHVPKKMSKVNLARSEMIPPSHDVYALPEDMRPKFLAKKPWRGAYGRPSWRGPSKTVITTLNLGGRQGEAFHPTQDR